MKDPYVVLGMNKEDGEEALRARYEELKKIYGEQRFKPGAEGNEGARKLSELESAWAMISAEFEKKTEERRYGDADYNIIDELIKSGDYDGAQAKLDAISDRPAEWHYYQAIVFYKREWMMDCRKQLEVAVHLAPGNAKYKTALDKLNMVIGNPNANPRTIGVDPTAMPQGGEGRACGGNMLSNCCLAYCLADCCCSMAPCCR